jgi:internalin A
VLEDKLTRQDRGVLDHSRLKEIWQERQNGSGYTARYYPYFLRLMEKFDVSYRLADDEHKSLVAQLVPPARPELPWDDRTPPPEGARTLALMCELSEPAPGLVAWLTVRHHRDSTGRHWRTGVFLRYRIDHYDSEALLELRDDQHLAIEVRAPSPDFFFNVVRDSVEDIITRRWPGLHYELLIPCPTQYPDGKVCPGKFKLGNLLRFRERGKTRLDCPECGETHDIGQLLTGFAVPPAPLQPQLERLQEQVSSGFDRLERYAADTADSMRRVLRAVATEVSDCPRLFTLTREQPAGMARLKPGYDHYQLTLWCEHSGKWHPWPDATYHLHQPKDWLVRVSPYANLVLKTLQLVVPVAAAAAGVTLTEDRLKHVKPELELMKTLVGKLPSTLAVENPELEALEPHSRLTAAEGEALRGVRSLLFQEDSMRSFGDLRRVLAPSGDFLWVCTTHYPDYDRGLPSIPSSTKGTDHNHRV